MIIKILVLIALGMSLLTTSVRAQDADLDVKRWTLEVFEPAKAVLSKDDVQKAIRLDIATGSTLQWHIQLYQGGIDLIEGQEYILKFNAKADRNRSVHVAASKDIADYTGVGLGQHVELTTEWTRSAIPFTAKGVIANHTRVPMFQVANATGSLWIKDVSVERAAPKVLRVVQQELLPKPLEVSQWALGVSEPAKAALSLEADALKVQIAQGGAHGWQIQLHPKALDLINGQRYTLRFAARADAPRVIDAATQLAVEPYPTLGMWNKSELTTQWKSFEYSFTAENAKAGQCKAPVFMFGGSAGTVWLKDLSFIGGVQTADSGRTEASLALLPEKLQTIEGWGICPSYEEPTWGPQWTLSANPAVHDPLFAVNYNYARWPLPFKVKVEADGSFDKKPLGDLLKVLRLHVQRGKPKYILSLWSPPEQWKTPPVDYADLDKDEQSKKLYPPDKYPTRKGTLDPTKVEEFTTWYVDSLKYIRQQGVPLPEVISVQNEPDWAAWYGSCVYLDQDRFVLHKAIKSIRKKLDAAGMQAVLISGPENGSPEVMDRVLGKNFSDLDADPELRNAIGAFQVHPYDDSADAWTAEPKYWDRLVELEAAAKKYNKPLWWTEYSRLTKEQPAGTRDADTFDAVFHMVHLNKDMVHGGGTHWFLWIAWVHADPGKLDGGLLTGDPKSPTKRKLWHILKRLWDEVPAGQGFRVQPMSSDDPEMITRYSDKFRRGPSAAHPNTADGRMMPIRPVHAVGFSNETGKTVLVLANDRSFEKRLTVSDLPRSAYRAYLTDAANSDAVYPLQPGEKGQIKLTLPPMSVLIVVNQP